MKRMISLVLSAFFILCFTSIVNAQCRYGDQLCISQERTLRIVREANRRLERESLRNRIGRYYPYYDNYSYGRYRDDYDDYGYPQRRMGRRERTITYGSIGAGAGYAIFGNKRGTVAGAVIGAGTGILVDRHENKDGMRSTNRPPRSTARIADDCYHVINLSGYDAEIVFENEIVRFSNGNSLLAPGQRVRVFVPPGSESAFSAIVHTPDGIVEVLMEFRQQQLVIPKID